MGLNNKEHSLLNTLYNEGHLNTSALAFKAKIPRVTSMRLLRALQQRGFVYRQALYSEVRWHLVRPELLLKKYTKLFEGEPGATTQKALALTDVARVTVFRGAEEMYETNVRFLIAHAGERLYAIESSGMWRHIVQVPVQKWIHVNNLMAQKKIIVEAIVESDFETQITEHADISLAQSLTTLAHELYVIPKGYLNSSTEILIFRDQALFLDWEQLVGVEIKNPSTVKMLKGMFDLLKRIGQPVN